MSDPITAIQSVQAGAALEAAAPMQTASGSGTDFATWMSREVRAVNTDLRAAEKGLQELAAGGGVSIHEVMMRTEEARLSFHLLVQVRNRVLEAYQEVMRMQG